MNIPTWIIGGISVLCAIYAAYDLWVKRRATASVDVVTSAVELLKPYKQEVGELRVNLQKAHLTINNLNDELEKAKHRADQLNSQLVDAQAEVGYLKVQVRILSDRLKDGGNIL